MPSAPQTTIFVVDDDDGVRSLAEAVLKKGGYDVRAFDTIPSALEGLREGSNPSLILLDGILPGMDAYDFIEHVSKDAALPTISCLVMSDMLDLSRFKDTPKVRIAGRLDKPFSPDQLMKAVLGALSDIDSWTGA